ncbi:hypothetical protein GCM10007897_32090 [Sphingobium jiangsuense]|nr:hypothetical protein GCM10007897_32090 [Sphingobium jiangsuense]
MQAALSQPVVWLFGAIRIDMGGIGGRLSPLCLLDGAGQLTINGETYVGADDFFGAIDSIDVISEADGEEAPEIRLSLLPPSTSAAAQLASPLMQGREVRVMVGAIDPTTGLTIGQPEIKFLGEIDVPTLSVSEGQRSLEFTVVSAFERLFEVEDGVRAQDGWHQSIWPGEKGLEYMTGTDKNLYWGARPPAASGQVGWKQYAMANAWGASASLLAHQ